MRRVNLIKNLEYNYRNRVIDEEKKVYDGDVYVNDNIELFKTVYKADELVDITTDIQNVVDDVKNSFIGTFNTRGGATEEQINFAEQTAKIIFGKLTDDIVTVIPAPCGFGKSSISLEILKKLIELHKNKLSTDGLILVTDRLDSLRKTQNDLKEFGLDGYTYILESWNENICKNTKVKSSDAKMCTPDNCPYFYKCKIYEQQREQKKYPILLITNARLRENGAYIKQYSTWDKNDNNSDEEKPNGKRTILLIDERPDVLDTVKVNKKLLNEISTEISRCDYSDTQEKTSFENMFSEISNKIIIKMQELRDNYKRFIVSNNTNEPICKTNPDFMLLWDKYMKGNYKRELEHIHTVLTKGGLYVYEQKTEFISTIGSKNLKDMYTGTFKTIVFDGTALYDPLYLGMYKEESIKYLDVENTRLYSNLTINAYLHHKLTKTTFKDKKYLACACGRFVNERMKIGFKKGYVVSYQSIITQINESIDTKYNIAKLNDELFYFGNTKGKNDMKDCNIMFQFGWDTYPDYEYVIRWLATIVKWDLLLNSKNSLAEYEDFSEKLTIKDRSKQIHGNSVFESFGHKCYEFGFPSLNEFKLFTILTNFYQEVHRTKLRNYNCIEEKIEVNIFSTKNIILDMIEQLFPKCSLNRIKDELSCFKESKAEGRKNKAKGYDEFNEWFDTWDGSLIKVGKIKESCGIDDKQWEYLKKHEIIKSKLDTLKQPKKGYYCKI